MSHIHYDDRFNDFLDAIGSGSVGGNVPDDELRADAETARRFHTMAQRSTPQRNDGRMSTAMRRTWEEISMPATSPVHVLAAEPVTAMRPFSTRSFSWMSIVSGVVAAVIVLGLVIGNRGFDGRLGGGADPGNLAMLPAMGTPVGVEPGGFCTTPGLSREDVLKRISREPISLSLSGATLESTSTDAETTEQVFKRGDQFFMCLAEGKPLSAMTYMSDVFLRDWIFRLMISEDNGTSNGDLVAILDELEKQQSAPHLAQRGNANIPQLGIEWHPRTTLDGHVHVSVSWPAADKAGDAASSVSAMLPKEVVFVKEEGLWKVHEFGYGPVPMEGPCC
jgi:hypothetical protein